MTTKASKDHALARYRAAVPPPAAPIYSRWRISADGVVTREPLPAFLCRNGMPEGFAIKGSD